MIRPRRPSARRARRPIVEPLEGRQLLATFTVSNTNASGNGSLAAAIASADGNNQANTIDFDSSFSTNQTITITSTLDLTDTGGLQTVTGPAASVTISGGGKVGVFEIGSGVTASLSGMTITGGSADLGGGLDNLGTATLTDVTVSGNTAQNSGGGLYNIGTATLTLNECTVSGNSSGGGGGLENLGMATLNDCTVSGNSTSTIGGGLFNSGTATLTDVTVSGNATFINGGGLENFNGTATLTDVTVSGNTAFINTGGLDNNGTATLNDTIVAGNGGSNIGGETNVAGPSAYNLIGTGGSGGLSNGVNHNIVLSGSEVAGLAPLGNYGGPTRTMALLPGSPAIDAGSNALIPAGITTDQRGTGHPRIVNSTVDIGAFESSGFTIAVTSGSGQTADVNEAFANPLVATVTAKNSNEPVAGGQVTFTVPASGASASLSVDPATIAANGTASTTPTANSTFGSYTVTASAAGVATPADFALTNAGSLVVNTTSDSADPGAGLTTLRMAIAYANSLTTGTATITFSSTVFGTLQTITLTSGQLMLSNTKVAETITGPAAGVTISGGGKVGVFEIGSGVTASLSGMTITGGSASLGGGLVSYGTATLTDVTVSGNSAREGGGLANYKGTATLTDVTVSGNSAQIGGGLFNDAGTATLTDVTVSGNSAGEGGGLRNEGTATLTDCTVSGNSARYLGGGLEDGAGTATLNDTIVAGNGGSDIESFVAVSSAYNLIGTGGSGGLSSGVNHNIVLSGSEVAGLAPLGSYGGTTRTMALLPGSPALGAGTAISGITTDQRGQIRGEVIDIGAVQASLVVESTAGSVVTGASSLTLPGAVQLADQFAGDEITFDPTEFNPAATITLSGNGLGLSNTALTTTITGPAAGVTISGGGKVGVFEIGSGVTASLSGMTITGGSADLGGGLDNLGTATLTDVTVSGNTAQNSGGGLYNSRTATLTLNDCTVSGNSTGEGGGLENLGMATLNDCTVSGNSTSTIGGGLFNSGTATLTDVTVSGNATFINGGGLENFNGTATLTDVTVSGNTAFINTGGLDNNGTATLNDTIVAGNGGSNIGGETNVAGPSAYNLIGTGGSGGLSNGVNHNIVLTGSDDPGLAPLGNYGGPTRTMALLPGSPAIGKGIGVSGITTDQRGATRASSGSVDIGAFQDQGYTVAVVSGSGQTALTGSAFPNPLVAVLTEDYANDPIPGASLTFTAPASGAGATLSAGSATTNASGQASVTARANATGGSYTVTASAAGVATPADFALTNKSTTVPTVTGVSSTTAAGAYGVGSVITITVGWSDTVVVTGSPKLALNSGGTATYQSGSGTGTLTFTYTVAAGQSANPLDEASTTALTLSGGTIDDQGSGNPAVLTLPAPGSAHSLSKSTIVIDTMAPIVTNISSTTPDGDYGLGAVITITVGWSKPVLVTGTPQLALNSGGTASYSGGSGTGTLTFTYTVAAGQDSSRLDYSSATALSLNGGTIEDTATNPNAANLTLSAPGAAGSLGANKSIQIDTVAPTILSYNVVFGTKNLTYDLIGSTRIDLPWKITGIEVVFSKPIDTADVKSLAGLSTTGLSGLGTNTLVWSINTISVGTFSTALLNSGTDAIKDAAGNTLAGAFDQDFKVLYGDVNGDGFVSSADMLAVYDDISESYNIFADLDGDGVVDTTDVQIARSQIGKQL